MATEAELILQLEAELRQQMYENAQPGVKPGRKHADARGVPCVGKGMTGAIPGSDPLAAVIAKEDRGKLWPTARDPIPRPEPYVPHVRTGKLGRRVRPEGKYF